MLNAFQEKYEHHNFTVLGFPCNQFGLQEPGNGPEIYNGVRYVRPGDNFEPNFPLFQKTLVNGYDAHPFFDFLKDMCPEPPKTTFADAKRLIYSPLCNSDIRWNFEKFLLNREGQPYKRYDPTAETNDMYKDIEYLLSEPVPADYDLSEYEPVLV